MTFTFV